MRHYWPIWRTALAAITPMVLVTAWYWNALTSSSLSLGVLGALVAGVLYTQLIEYWCHRVPMHQGLPFLQNIRRNHLEHHRIFYGDTFQTSGPEDLEHIPGRYWVFPALFAVHFSALALILPADAVLAFMLGTVLHYLAFEFSHWFTHIEGNRVDRVLLSIPWVGALRAYQIEHHRQHHEVPEFAFNFNPPYLGDRLLGQMPSVREPVFVAPSVAPAAPVALTEPPSANTWSLDLWKRPLVRYGSVAAVGAALIGAAVVAHGLWTHTRRSPLASEHSA